MATLEIKAKMESSDPKDVTDKNNVETTFKKLSNKKK